MHGHLNVKYYPRIYLNILRKRMKNVSVASIQAKI